MRAHMYVYGMCTIECMYMYLYVICTHACVCSMYECVIRVCVVGMDVIICVYVCVLLNVYVEYLHMCIMYACLYMYA